MTPSAETEFLRKSDSRKPFLIGYSRIVSLATRIKRIVNIDASATTLKEKRTGSPDRLCPRLDGRSESDPSARCDQGVRLRPGLHGQSQRCEAGSPGTR